jgi:hypothetical protein
MSLSKSESARINGGKSRGPKTPEGKAKSSQNAIKHGIFAQVVVLKTENADLFAELTQDYIRRFEPRDEVEFALVEQMVAATWRLSRCWELQTQTMNLEMARDQDPDSENLKARSFHAAIGNGSAMQLLHRFENSYERIITRSIRTLANLRKNFPMPDAGPQKRENEPTAPHNDSIVSGDIDEIVSISNFVSHRSAAPRGTAGLFLSGRERDGARAFRERQAGLPLQLRAGLERGLPGGHAALQLSATGVPA